MHDGRAVIGLPLGERKALLQRLLARAPGVLYVGDLPAREELFAQAVLPLQLEGFVAKRRDSIYVPGERSLDCLKVKRKRAVPPG